MPFGVYHQAIQRIELTEADPVAIDCCRLDGDNSIEKPATILIVINRSTRSHPILSATGTFAVNILAEHQHEISDRFRRNSNTASTLVNH